MATTATDTSATSATTKSSRGKDQIQWSDEVWKALDQAVSEEMMRTRVGAKFLPHVHVHKKRTTVEADVVVVPPVMSTPPTVFDPALSVDESQTVRIQEYWTTFRLSVAQVEAEEHQESQANNSTSSTSSTSSPAAAVSASGTAANGQPTGSTPHRASTAVSLALRTANILAQAEDLILFNGQNAVKNHSLFTNQQIQYLDKNLVTNLDSGLLNIGSAGDIGLPGVQVIPVHPSVAGVPGTPPRYAENTLNAVAQAFSVLQGLGHYENYALILQTIPFADLHQALPTTLIEPIEPISHLVTAGIYGTGTLPPFAPSIPGSPAGLPTTIGGQPLTTIPGFGSANVLYTGVLVSLSGNTMDHVRGLMEDSLDVLVTFNQKDQNEQYRFRVVQRFALRLKDPSAAILLLFLDS